jgi:hypothetical protein
VPGAKFSTKTSALATSALKISTPSGDRRLSVTLRLLALRRRKYQESRPSTSVEA